MNIKLFLWALVCSFGLSAQVSVFNGGSGSSVGTQVTYTVSGLPAASTDSGKIVWASDGLTLGDCTTGGGTFLVPCKSNGTVYAYASVDTTNASNLSSGTTPAGREPTHTGAYQNSAGSLSGVLRDFVSANDYGSLQAAITAVGFGTVEVPANYSGNSTISSNPNNVRIMDLRSSAHTVLNAKTDFGAKGDGFISVNCSMTNGSATLTCPSYTFLSTDVSKVVAVNSASAANFIHISTIASVSAGVATLSAAATQNTTGGSNTWITTDDTAALGLWMAAANATQNATAYLPSGKYWMNGTLVSTQNTLIQGDGYTASIIMETDFNKDLLVLENPTPIVFAGITPNQSISNLGLAGLGSLTTGNLLVNLASYNVALDNVMFYGHGGRAILESSERMFMHNIKSSDVRQTFSINSNRGGNESYISDFAFTGPGQAFNDIFGNGSNYCYNINATAGVMPGSSGTFLQDQHTAINIYNSANFVVTRGSIKALTCGGGITISDTSGASEISHIYMEGFNTAAASLPLVYGGKHEKTTTSSVTTTSSLTFDVADARWFPAYVGSAAEQLLLGGSLSNDQVMLIYPPDFVAGSSTPSSLGGTILQGSFEYVSLQGILHDATGSGWHVLLNTGGRAANGSTAFAWPVGAVFENIYSITGGFPVHVTNVHMSLGQLNTTNYTMSCDPDNEKTCADVVVGIEPDLFFKWGTANQPSGSRTLVFSGANTISTATGLVGVETHTAAGVYTQGAGGTTAPVVTNTQITSGSLSGQKVTRSIYASGSGGSLTYSDPITPEIQLTGASTVSPIGLFGTFGTFSIGSGINASGITYYGSYCMSDDPQSGQSYQRICAVGNRNTGLQGLRYDIWNGTALTNVFNVTGVAGGSAAVSSQMSLLMANGTTSLTTSGNESIFTMPGVDASHQNIITSPSGTGIIDFQGITGLWIDSAHELRCNTTHNCTVIGMLVDTADKFAGSGTATFAAQAGAGTGATATCATSHVCDTVSGEVTLTTGTGPATGTQLIITTTITRTNFPNCSVSIEGGTTFLASSHTTSATTITVSAGVALAASTAYNVTYACWGQ